MKADKLLAKQLWPKWSKNLIADQKREERRTTREQKKADELLANRLLPMWTKQEEHEGLPAPMRAMTKKEKNKAKSQKRKRKKAERAEELFNQGLMWQSGRNSQHF